MKGVIVDIKGSHAAVLGQNGTVFKISNRNYSIGDSVSVSCRTGFSFSRAIRYALSAAAVLIAVLSIGAGAAYTVPYGTVSLDVNPSIEYTVNCFDYVIAARGINSDGVKILSELDMGQLKHQHVTQAVAATLQQIEKDGYLNKDGADVLLSSSAPNASHAESVRCRLEQSVNENLHLPTRSIAVTPEDVRRAHENGTTAGRQWEQDQQENLSESDSSPTNDNQRKEIHEDISSGLDSPADSAAPSDKDLLTKEEPSSDDLSFRNESSSKSSSDPVPKENFFSDFFHSSGFSSFFEKIRNSEEPASRQNGNTNDSPDSQ